MWFNVDIKDVVFEGVQGLEGDGILLLVLLSVDKVDGPGIGDKADGHQKGEQPTSTIHEQQYQAHYEELHLDLQVESPRHAHSLSVVDQVIYEQQ